MKVITDGRLKSRLLATIRMINVIEKENLDIFGEGVKGTARKDVEWPGERGFGPALRGIQHRIQPTTSDYSRK